VLSVLPKTITAGPYLLRLPTPSDTAALIVACQDPEIPHWTTIASPYGEAEADAFVNRETDRVGRNALERNYLVVDVDDTVLGMFGLVRVREDDECGEVGYWLAQEARGKGIGVVALTALVDAVFAAGYLRVDAEAIVGNHASCRLLERVGFQHEGILRSIGWNGTGERKRRIDIHMYARLP
jgi:RimJ/RimL family protein N-acetyltransferase